MNRYSPNARRAVVGAQGLCAPGTHARRVLRTLLLWHFVLCFAGMITACQSAPAKRYPLQAEVISVDAPRKLIVVKHGEIPSLMPAMTMSYAVLDSKEIGPLHPGDKITAELVVADEKGHLEKIVLVSKATNTPPTSQPN